MTSFTYKSPISYEAYRVEYTIESGDDGSESEKMVGVIHGNSANEVRAKIREQYGCGLLSVEVVRPIDLRPRQSV